LAILELQNVRIAEEKGFAREKINGIFFQLNPSSAEEIHLRWMKSLCDEICLAAGVGGGFCRTK